MDSNDNNEYTFQLPAATLEKWLTALESGEYTQGSSALCYIDTTTGQTRYCCLGVLQMAVDGRITGKSLPSSEWCLVHGMLDMYGFADQNPRLPSCETLGARHRASYVNDSGVYTFKDIAQAIRKHCKPV